MQIEIPPVITIFDPITDWRKKKGKRYSLTSLFQYIILATLCGKSGVRPMSRWSKKLPAGTTERLSIAADRHPSAVMLCRVLWQLPPEVVEEGIGAWANQVHCQLIAVGVARGIAIDGKSIRRAASLGRPNAFLVAAICHQVRAAFRNIAISLARLAGFTSVTEALDIFSAEPALALDLMGL